MIKSKTVKWASFLAISIFYLSSCYYDVEEELYPAGCNIVDVSFQNSIQPILSAQCLNCHSEASKQGGVVLEGYDAVKVYADNGKLLSSVNHDGNASPMPKGQNKMGSCSIAQIEAWIQQGTLNN